jgi:hypothetical protein
MKMRQRYAAAPEEPKEMMAAEAVRQAHGLLDEIARLEEVQQLFGSADTVMVSGHCQDPSRPYGHSFSVRMSKEEIVDSITVVLSARIDEARAKLGELGVE